VEAVITCVQLVHSNLPERKQQPGINTTKLKICLKHQYAVRNKISKSAPIHLAQKSYSHFKY